MFIPHGSPSADEWEYFVFSNHISFHMRPVETLENVFEPVLMVHLSHRIVAPNT
jgi:hypothetical protein